MVLYLPYETKVDVICATPATQSTAVLRSFKISPRTPPSAIITTITTQNEDGWEMVPRLSSKTEVDVRLRYAYHGKYRGVTGNQNQPNRTTYYYKYYACHIKPRRL